VVLPQAMYGSKDGIIGILIWKQATNIGVKLVLTNLNNFFYRIEY
jgi:hypothetical protein